MGKNGSMVGWKGITFTLLRKFQVEFMAALYLASNMHEPAFKPLPIPIFCSNKRKAAVAINLCICRLAVSAMC